MSAVLDQEITTIPLPYLVVCEGFGDVQFISALLSHLQITNCNVGCPSTRGGHGSGKSGIKKYLEAVAAAIAAGRAELKGILVVGDADENEVTAFGLLAGAIENAGFDRPTQPFTTIGKPTKVAAYVMPGTNRKGTLEHLLWDAVIKQSPHVDGCVVTFSTCVGDKITAATENQKAKMKMSALVGVSCPGNPWASPAMMFSDAGNPVPIDSDVFKHLSEFITKFVT
jgi:hypothetical protein